ncbi:nicotinamidase-related amidase [Catalinimonas alkaloidigena]|uniref:cysteine hydrolase family protein n=1 Tax=Catalinimonas alkaloidigena TaxID=1075417 RepID=UPI00240506A7|nr:cysteine hydrolase family protein [Catalinimonas alkaloidigena]MDF9798060.1 nicotinamidase-related amidase [Catalinimonas alkaloidigena]
MTPKGQPALLLIDIQKGMDDIAYWGGHRNNPEAEKNAARLLQFWREHALPVFHVRHNSTNPESRLAKGKPGNEIKDIVRPLESETVIEKSVNSAFIGTELQPRLDKLSIKKLVITGLTTNHCVSTTTRMAGNLGYETYLVSDATATFDRLGMDGKKYSAEIMHATELASLEGEFARVLTTEQLLQLLK